MSTLTRPKYPTHTLDDGQVVFDVRDAEKEMQQRLGQFINNCLLTTDPNDPDKKIPTRKIILADQNVPIITDDASVVIKPMLAMTDGQGEENEPKFTIYNNDGSTLKFYEHVVSYLIKTTKDDAYGDLRYVRQAFQNKDLRYWTYFGGSTLYGYRKTSTVANTPTILDRQTQETGARMTITLSYISFEHTVPFGVIKDVGIGSGNEDPYTGTGGIVVNHSDTRGSDIFPDGIPADAESTDTYRVIRTKIDTNENL